jgi:putative solute:sodium symporter small subunit
MRSDLIEHSEPSRSTCANRYWGKNLRLIAALMAIWASVTFGVGFFARELDFPFLGWPFSFWVAGQGALVVYVVVVAYYAWAMNRLDRSFGDAGDPGANIGL